MAAAAAMTEWGKYGLPRAGQLDQVEAVAVEVGEDGDLAVGLSARRFEELHAASQRNPRDT